MTYTQVLGIRSSSLPLFMQRHKMEFNINEMQLKAPIKNGMLEKFE